MISLTRKLSHQLNSVFRRCLLTKRHRYALDVVLQSDADGLRIRAWNSDAAIEFHQPGKLVPNRIVLPLEAFKACAGSRSEPVDIERSEANHVVVRWNDRGIPQTASYQAANLEAEFLTPPTRMQRAGEGFLSALRDAIDTTDSESIRYAVDCVRLRGACGRIDATDSRQALLQSGFKFPWDEDVLVPANPVFKSELFARETEIEIGRTKDWVAFRMGLWTIYLPIEKERRFPDVDGCIPTPTATKSRLRLSESDAKFLVRSLSRLPNDNLSNGSVTVDLNGAVAVRARSQEQAGPTELLLGSSSRSGEEICLNSNRIYLERAVRLGFRELGFVSAESPAICSDGRRKYVWALLGETRTVKPADNAVRIESPQPDQAEAAVSTPDVSQRPTASQASPSKTRAGQSTPMECRQPAMETSVELSPIDQARRLQDGLRSALKQTRELLTALRGQRKRLRLRKTRPADQRFLHQAG